MCGLARRDNVLAAPLTMVTKRENKIEFTAVSGSAAMILVLLVNCPGAAVSVYRPLMKFTTPEILAMADGLTKSQKLGCAAELERLAVLIRRRGAASSQGGLDRIRKENPSAIIHLKKEEKPLAWIHRELYGRRVPRTTHQEDIAELAYRFALTRPTEFVQWARNVERYTVAEGIPIHDYASDLVNARPDYKTRAL